MPEPTAPIAAPMAEPREECSLVMKGGITSGVVYPPAVTELATKFRFRRIGGSSAGALAGVLAAAAEYHRTTTGTPAPAPPSGDGGAAEELRWDPAAAGFDRLRRLPDHLGTQLPLLFEPSPGTKGLFEFLIAWIEPGWSVGRKLAVSVWRLFWWGWKSFLAAFVVLLLPAFASSAALVGGIRADTWFPVLRATALWLPLAVLGGLLAALVTLGIGAWRAVNRNGFGMVNGHRPHAPDDPGSDDVSNALTDWLTREINLTAGKDPRGTPLTFGDLWGAETTAKFRTLFTEQRSLPDRPDLPGFWRYRRRAPSIGWGTLDPDLDLRVMTTCLTHRVPRSFPFFDDTFAYCPSCLAEYFPRTVCEQVAVTSRPMNADPAAAVRLRCPDHDDPLRRFPFAPDLPVVMAARLSLSFPVLISAVPFYYLDGGRIPDAPGGATSSATDAADATAAVDTTGADDAAAAEPGPAKTAKLQVVKAWFSDGGITSNFPMQFFDDWLPRRPTFGINLASFNPRYHPGEVNLPAATVGAKPVETPIRSVLGLLITMVTTMQDWPDQLQMDAPGFKDRIVTVCTVPGEGGLNLTMSAEQIAGLAGKGTEAGAKLRDDFDFRLHRWIRFRIAMNGLSLALDRFRRDLPALTDALPDPWPGSYGFSAARERAVRWDAAALGELAEEWATQDWPANRDAPPRPEPSLRFGSTTR